jgi:thiol-disulfide isomerase/thioredoxin
VNGRIVSNRDPQFRNKVVLAIVTGTWCPNCHDEAPFLTELYRSYHQKGLEIVALGFEEADQLKNPVRPRAFVKQFGIEYPFLLVGEPEEAPEKISQAENLNAFPTTFVLGRDGRVRTVHAGFASVATGKVHAESEKAMSEEIERLLAEKAPAGN